MSNESETEKAVEQFVIPEDKKEKWNDMHYELRGIDDTIRMLTLNRGKLHSALWRDIEETLKEADFDKYNYRYLIEDGKVEFINTKSAEKIVSDKIASAIADELNPNLTALYAETRATAKLAKKIGSMIIDGIYEKLNPIKNGTGGTGE